MPGGRRGLHGRIFGDKAFSSHRRHLPDALRKALFFLAFTFAIYAAFTVLSLSTLFFVDVLFASGYPSIFLSVRSLCTIKSRNLAIYRSTMT